MTDLRDDTEVEVFDVDGIDPEQMIDELVRASQEGEEITEEDNISEDEQLEEPEAEHLLPASELEDEVDTFHVGEGNEETISSSAHDEIPLFYVDTDPMPVAESSLASHNSVPSVPLGTSASQHSEEETIVFKPRVYRQPEPIFIPLPLISPAPVPEPASFTTHFASIAAYVDPRALTRREKKAGKRDKRGRKKRGGRQRRVIIEGSDIGWGSDEPPGEILGVEGIDDGDGEEGSGNEGDDVEVLRDYLEGTLLNAKAEMEDDEREESEEDSEVEREMEKELEKRFGGEAHGGESAGEKMEEGKGVDEENEADEERGEKGDGEDEGDWESSSGSGESSDLGEIKAALQVPVSQSDKDEDEEVDLFAGKDSWDETDWFIRNMEVGHLLRRK